MQSEIDVGSFFTCSFELDKLIKKEKEVIHKVQANLREKGLFFKK